MTEAVPETIPCRLCTTPVARDAAVCGVKEPWISDEPTTNPRVIRVAMWIGGVVLVGLTFVVSAVLMFTPAEQARDEKMPGIAAERHEPR